MVRTRGNETGRRAYLSDVPESCQGPLLSSAFPKIEKSGGLDHASQATFDPFGNVAPRPAIFDEAPPGQPELLSFCLVDDERLEAFGEGREVADHVAGCTLSHGLRGPARVTGDDREPRRRRLEKDDPEAKKQKDKGFNAPSGAPPMFVPFRLREMDLANRGAATAVEACELDRVLGGGEDLPDRHPGPRTIPFPAEAGRVAVVQVNSKLEDFKTASGKVTTQWPGYLTEYRLRTSRVKVADYVFG